MKKTVYTVIVALLCLCVIIYGINVYGDFNGGAGTDVEITIPEGANGAEILDILESNGIVDHPLVFRLYASSTGLTSKYRSGSFTVNTGYSYKQILETLTGDPNSNSDEIKITIPEGFEVEQIAAAMEKAGVCSKADFLAAASRTDYDFEFLKDVDFSSRKYALEGYLFPETYTFKKGVTAKEVVVTMLSTFEKVISKYDVAHIDKTVILASIIEREALGDEDRHLVSSVFHNRLNGKGGLTKLQSCATVQYILGERKDVLSEADTRIDSPYNTYMYEGLPIGPIANPGEASIEAALNPDETDYLYFGVNKEGKHTFSKTYEEHLTATR
ncbi:MAG: endolytic transglycosylase MltG [Clostridia bacterium]|nr:endolytic transglycosylase MltG [Clostridia bacterium]